MCSIHRQKKEKHTSTCMIYLFIYFFQKQFFTVRSCNLVLSSLSPTPGEDSFLVPTKCRVWYWRVSLAGQPNYSHTANRRYITIKERTEIDNWSLARISPWINHALWTLFGFFLVALQYTDHAAHYRSNYPLDFHFALS